MKISGNLTKFWRKQNCTFFEKWCYIGRICTVSNTLCTAINKNRLADVNVDVKSNTLFDDEIIYIFIHQNGSTQKRKCKHTNKKQYKNTKHTLCTFIEHYDIHKMYLNRIVIITINQLISVYCCVYFIHIPYQTVYCLTRYQQSHTSDNSENLQSERHSLSLAINQSECLYTITTIHIGPRGAKPIKETHHCRTLYVSISTLININDGALTLINSKGYSTKGSRMMLTPCIQIYFRPRVTLSFDLLTDPLSKLTFSCPCLWTTCANWHQNRLSKYRVHKFGNRGTNRRTNGQIENIMCPPSCRSGLTKA